MIIKKYNLFLEASIGDLMKIKSNDLDESELLKHINRIAKKEFDINQQFPKEIDLKDDCTLRVKWYNTATHNLGKRIKERTSFKSLDDFIEYLQSVFNIIFPDKCGKELFEKGRYSIYLKEYNISILIEFDLNKNMGNTYYIDVVTILPGKKGDNIVRFIEI
jgi:hypothetical protein